MQEAIIKNFVLKHFRYFVLFLSSNQRYDRCFRVTKIPLRNISSLNNSLSPLWHILVQDVENIFLALQILEPVIYYVTMCYYNRMSYE